MWVVNFDSLIAEKQVEVEFFLKLDYDQVSNKTHSRIEKGISALASFQKINAAQMRHRGFFYFKNKFYNEIIYIILTRQTYETAKNKTKTLS